MNDHNSFFTSVRHVYVHSVRSMAWAYPIPAWGVDLGAFAERALVMASRGDIVCLHERPDPVYLDYLRRLGVGPREADIVVCPDLGDQPPLPLSYKLTAGRRAWQHLVERLRGAVEVVLHPYISTHYERTLASRLERQLQVPVRLIGGETDVIEYYDQKHHVRAMAEDIGVPVAPGEVVAVKQPAHWFRVATAIRRQLPHTGKVIVRGASGNGGSSVVVVAGNEDISRCLHHLRRFDKNQVYLVDVMLNVTSSPNIGMLIDPQTRDIHCFSCTEQVLQRDLVHAGNRHPATAKTLPDMIVAAEQLAQQMRRRGVTGHLGFDFCEYDSPSGGPAYFLAEMNPRVNGATYSQTLFNAVNRSQIEHGGMSLGAFQAVVLPTHCRTYSALENSLAQLLFEPGAESGVIPMRHNLLRHGRCGFLLVTRNAEDLEEIHQRLRIALDVESLAGTLKRAS